MLEQPEGFPLTWRERRALDHFQGGPSTRPRDVAAITITNLQGRKWIIRSERLEDFGPELYSITEEGRVAIEFDDCVRAAGFHPRAPGVRLPGASAFKDLHVKLAEFKISAGRRDD
jgi:hypothetical protein